MTEPTITPQPALELMPSRQFPNWLAEQRVSLAFTTYQSGKLFLIGVKGDGQLSIFERTFNRAMGLWADRQTIWLSTLYQLWRFENTLSPREMYDGYDALYVPQVAYTTGDLDIHDVGVDDAGRPIFVNTLFGCLATTSETHSFKPLWTPPWISRLAAEDRCHLNGLAMRDGQPAYVTSVSQSDVADGWRDRRRDGGTVTDVAANRVLLSGLSMPHSPRWHRGSLYLLEAGTGHLVRVIQGEEGTAHVERIAFCPGFLRGLAFAGDFALVGTSKPRENRTFSGLELNETLKAKDTEARCGLYIIDLRTGDIVHWLRIEGVVTELYDVAVLPGIRRPMALGLKTDEIRRMLTMEPAG